MLRAAPTFLPRMRSATTRTLRGVMRRYLSLAVASMVSLALAYFAAAAAAAGAGAPGPAPGLAAFLSPVWAWEVRVGAHSPRLWPTQVSGTESGQNLRPCLTAEG